MIKSGEIIRYDEKRGQTCIVFFVYNMVSLYRHRFSFDNNMFKTTCTNILLELYS